MSDVRRWTQYQISQALECISDDYETLPEVMVDAAVYDRQIAKLKQEIEDLTNENLEKSELVEYSEADLDLPGS